MCLCPFVWWSRNPEVWNWEAYLAEDGLQKNLFPVILYPMSVKEIYDLWCPEFMGGGGGDLGGWKCNKLGISVISCLSIGSSLKYLSNKIKFSRTPNTEIMGEGLVWGIVNWKLRLMNPLIIAQDFFSPFLIWLMPYLLIINSYELIPGAC